MSVLIFMIPMALLMGLGFVVAFLWSAKNDQFEDLETPAMRMLDDGRMDSNFISNNNFKLIKQHELEDSSSCQNK